MRDKGKLVTWNDDQGHGFIAPFSGARRLTVIVNCAVLAWLLTPGGRAIIR